MIYETLFSDEGYGLLYTSFWREVLKLWISKLILLTVWNIFDPNDLSLEYLKDYYKN